MPRGVKASSNRQKSNLKPGSHKLFIDRVWERIHCAWTESDDEDEESDTKCAAGPHGLLQLSAPPNQKTVSTPLIHESDRIWTSDLIHATLLQVEPCQTFREEEGGFPGLTCLPLDRKFFTNDSEHLGDLMITIANNMCASKECSSAIKSQIEGYKKTHDIQLQQLKEWHVSCMARVWQRMVEASNSFRKL